MSDIEEIQDHSPECDRPRHEDPPDPPSHLIRTALAVKGYRFVTRFHGPTTVSGGEHRTFTFYTNGTQVLLLDVTYDALRREELACELYRPVSATNSIEDTISAIP